MKIVEGKEKEYKDWFDKNEDPYERGIFTFGEAWAGIMEEKVAKGEKLVDIAKQASHEADTDGITGFMYGAAVLILSQVWIYGEELRVWHNLDAQIKKEGERANESGGVLNPALLNIEL